MKDHQIFSFIFRFYVVYMIVVSAACSNGYSSNTKSQVIGNGSISSEQPDAEDEEVSDSISLSADHEIYGIITNMGVITFQAYDSSDSVVKLGMQLIVVRDSAGAETRITFMTGLYMMGDSLRGRYAPGEGETLSYFTEKYAPQYRPVVDEMIPNIDGHLTGFALTEDLANDLSSRPLVNTGN